MSPARILLFTGKGGVGTTTIAAATALRIADGAKGTGSRTLLVSTGGPSTVDDLFDREPGTAAMPIAPGLWVDGLGAGEPGGPSEESRSMELVVERSRSGDWDTIVLDARGATPPPDQEQVSVRLVVTAERLAVAEARRTATRLALHGHTVDEVVANRLLPDHVVDPWLEEWRRAQAEHLAALEATFAGVAVLRAHQAASEPAGVEALRAFARELYGDDDPASTAAAERPLRIVRTDGGYRLTLAVPFASRDTIDLARQGDELLLAVDGHRRRLLLPDSLRRRTVGEASFVDGHLVVDFVDPV